MGIKRFILEEIDDFGFVKDINPYDIFKDVFKLNPETKYVGIDDELTGEEAERIVKILGRMGYKPHSKRFTTHWSEGHTLWVTSDNVLVKGYRKSDYHPEDGDKLVPNIFKDIILEQDDFDFIRNVKEDPLAVGNHIFISNVSTTNKSLLTIKKRHGGDSYCILEIVNIKEGRVYYEPIKHSKNWPIRTGFANDCTIQHANKIMDEGYWRILSNVPERLMNKRRAKPEDFLPYIIYDKTNLNESDDLSWMENTYQYDGVKFYTNNQNDFEYYIEDKGGDSVTILWDEKPGLWDSGYVTYKRSVVDKFFNDGTWIHLT